MPPVTPPRNVRWRQSLYFRVMVLCGVLLLLLLGLVVVISRYYLGEVVDEMQADAERIAEEIQVLVEENQDLEKAELQAKVMSLREGFDMVEVREGGSEINQGSVYIERHDDGRFTWVALVPIELDSRKALMRATVTIVPQVEIVRAFTNRYVLTLTAAFVLALGLMVYFISKALRPLKDLSESCAAISAGDWREVTTRNATGEIRALEETFNHMVASLREKALVEAKLRQAQRLSALGNLAAGVAHDVRNPLNAIKLLSSHAIDTIDDVNSPAVKPLQIIRNEVDRLEEIVSSFLSLARERELSPEPQRVDGLLAECIRLFHQEAEDRKVRLTAELRAGDTELMLDAKQWNRAILNILLNALEACPAGGRVRVFSRLTNDACQIEVRDDGPGMTTEALERVFEPYFTTKPGGTGLGLSITRGIIQEHGGTVEVTSSPGHGCQVLITMPLQTTKAP
jgi:signal transduction histidine kinase